MSFPGLLNTPRQFRATGLAHDCVAVDVHVEKHIELILNRHAVAWCHANLLGSLPPTPVILQDVLLLAPHRGNDVDRCADPESISVLWMGSRFLPCRKAVRILHALRRIFNDVRASRPYHSTRRLTRSMTTTFVPTCRSFRITSRTGAVERYPSHHRRRTHRRTCSPLPSRSVST